MSKTGKAKPVDILAAIPRLDATTLGRIIDSARARREELGRVDHDARPPSRRAALELELSTSARHGDARMRAQLETAIGDIDRLMPTLPLLLDRIRQAQDGQPRAASYDSGGGSPIVWCDTHEQAVRDCHRTCVDHGTDLELTCRVHGERCTRTRACTGTPLLVRSDPAGDAATNPDTARQDERALIGACVALCRATGLWMDIAVRNTARPATGALRAQTEADNKRWCESCCRIVNPITKAPRQEQPWAHIVGQTDVGGRLERPMWLCEWCYKIVVRAGEQLSAGPRLPTIEELERHHNDGKPIRWHDMGANA